MKISEIKGIREKFGLSHIVIFGVSEDGTQFVATHGKTAKNGKEAAEAGNKLKKSLGWEDSLCNSKPLERICGKCFFWQYGYHRPGDPIPPNMKGDCYHEPNKVIRFEKDIACCNMEPNC